MDENEPILTSITSDKKPVKEHQKTLPSKFSIVVMIRYFIGRGLHVVMLCTANPLLDILYMI